MLQPQVFASVEHKAVANLECLELHKLDKLRHIRYEVNVKSLVDVGTNEVFVCFSAVLSHS